LINYNVKYVLLKKKNQDYR